MNTPDAYSADGHPVAIMGTYTEDGVKFAAIRYLDGHLPGPVGGRLSGTEIRPIWEHRVEDGKVVRQGGDYYNPADWVVERGLQPVPASHDAKFAAHRARREAERATAWKVTWRKVDDLTGGGWSGLGTARPDVLTRVFKVGRTVYRWGVLANGALIDNDDFAGVAGNLQTAKVCAADALRRYLTHKAPEAQKETIMTETTATPTLTAETFMEGIDGGEAVRAGKAPYARLQANGKTLGYADDRKDGFLFSVSNKAIEGAPKTAVKGLEPAGESRQRMHVTAANAKAATALVAWLAKKAQG